MQSGYATRIDVATDLVNAPMSDLLVRSVKAGKGIVYVGMDGLVQTLYSGISGGVKNSDQIVYDKSQEAADKGKVAGFDGIVHTRVELRKSGAKQKLANLLSIENLFDRVVVFHPGQCPAACEPLVWNLFLDSCRLRGVDNALARVPQPLAAELSVALHDAETVCWRSQKLWSLWPIAVEASGLLSAY